MNNLLKSKTTNEFKKYINTTYVQGFIRYNYIIIQVIRLYLIKLKTNYLQLNC